eukprot:1524797-Rhodomonas_salina.5
MDESTGKCSPFSICGRPRGKNNGFCVVKFAGQEHKTTPKRDTSSPDWEEVLRFDVQDVGREIRDLELVVMDWEIQVGTVTIPSDVMTRLMRAEIGWKGEGSYHLMYDRVKDGCVIGSDKEKTTVTIRAQLLGALPPPHLLPGPAEQKLASQQSLDQQQRPVSPPDLPQQEATGSRVLEFKVVSTRHLPKMDVMGKCDPFCVVKFAEQEHKTTTKKNTYSADWEEVFRFDVDDVGNSIGGLKLDVMDWDRMGANEMVGSFTIPANVMTRLMRAEIGWEGEGMYHLMSDGKKKEA